MLLNFLYITVGILLFSDFSVADIDEYQCRELFEYDATTPGTLKSPFYGERPYHNGLWCEYRIRAPEGYRIKITFKDFDVQASNLCAKDFLLVYTKDKKSSIAKLCGSTLPNPLLSLEGENEIRFLFISDVVVGKRGFVIQYESSPYLTSVCDTGLLECRNRNCFKSSQKCDGVDDCGDGTDEEDCGKPVDLQPEKCGVQEIEPKASKNDLERMVGGEEVVPNSWPWQVSLQYPSIEENSHFCGGTLINEQWVLTAIHCISGPRYPGSIKIRIGAHNLMNKTEYEQVRFAVKLIGYPDLENDDIMKGSMMHDIALLKLNAPVKFNKGVQPACIPKADMIPRPGWQCYGTGWGETRGSGSSGRLKQLDMVVKSRNDCGFYEESQICVAKPYHSTCHGDSGSPLNCRIGGRWYSYGALSLLVPTNYITGLCSGPGAITLYSGSVFKTDWIRNTITKHS